MKKACLLVGFFILTTSSQGVASNIKTDTLPARTWFQPHSFSTTDFRSSFYRWRTSGNKDAKSVSYFVSLSSNVYLTPAYRFGSHLNWWPQVSVLSGKQAIGLNAFFGFVQGFSAGLSAANNYYFKNAYDPQINKSFYSISSFLIGAGVGTVLGLKDPRRFPY